ncbi:YdcH family protein [Roseobacter sp.]|uniref:YdcH family protein n=1 Tax=Roseobacter sp. TaxID=1907202 RepID=UPI00385F968A
MSHTPHELADDFPEHTARIHDLRETDAHFRKLSDAYHDANRAVHRAETNVEPIDSQYETELRKQRMRIKDEIATILNKTQAMG